MRKVYVILWFLGVVGLVQLYLSTPAEAGRKFIKDPTTGQTIFLPSTMAKGEEKDTGRSLAKQAAICVPIGQSPITPAIIYRCVHGDIVCVYSPDGISCMPAKDLK